MSDEQIERLMTNLQDVLALLGMKLGMLLGTMEVLVQDVRSFRQDVSDELEALRSEVEALNDALSDEESL